MIALLLLFFALALVAWAWWLLWRASGYGPRIVGWMRAGKGAAVKPTRPVIWLLRLVMLAGFPLWVLLEIPDCGSFRGAFWEWWETFRTIPGERGTA